MADEPGKRQAQQRVDRIHAFRHELQLLVREGALSLSEEQRSALDAHLDKTLRELGNRFDVDVSQPQRQFSVGMRIVSTLGGLAFCAAIFLFFYRYWGLLATPIQAGILVAVPVLGLIAIDFVARREKTRYYTSLIGLVVFAAFIVNLIVLGTIFNLIPTPNAFLAWGLLGLLMAYAYGLRLPLAAGLISLVLFVGATAITWTGAYFGSFAERPELFLAPGLAAVAVPMIFRHQKATEFPSIYRLIGLLFIFISLLILGHAGNLSYLPFPRKNAEGGYQILSFLVAGCAIFLGIRHRLNGTVNLGSAFFSIILFWRLTDWWWDWMPKYLFCFIIGLISLALLAVFRRLRQRLGGALL